MQVMNESDLQKKIEYLRLRIASGQNPEDNKLELKSRWYSLKNTDDKIDPHAQNEFLKDLVALANTPGLDGFLIIGMDEQGGLNNSPFSLSGLKDQTEIRNLVVKNVDTPVEFILHEIPIADSGSTKIISIFEVPLSNDRPHVIHRYVTPKQGEIQNYIPIRKSTGVFAANRNDLELMYHERTHLNPEYALEISSYKPRFLVGSSIQGLSLEFQLVFQNTGEKGIAVAEAEIEILPDQQLATDQPYKIRLDSYKTETSYGHSYLFSSRPFVIESGKLGTLSASFSLRLPGDAPTRISNDKSFRFLIRATDTNGKQYQSKILERSF